MDNPFTTQPSSPEMPAAASRSTAGAARRFQPPDLPKAEPFKTSKMFAISKLALRLLNLVAVASIIWHLAEHITLAFRRDWRSICPGAHVGVHLILWLFAVLVVSFYSVELANMLCFYENRKDCDEFYGTFSSQSTAKGYFGIMKALTALNAMLLALHFTLFVMACIETDRGQVYEKKRKIRHLMVAPGLADGRMYYMPLNEPLQENGTVGAHSQACSPPPVG
ncbi:hypothetical protein LA080_009974 [Diaporthe eres]|nr:hypothetical protein LA080_009974 [Diaporthe eres]